MVAAISAGLAIVGALLTWWLSTYRQRQRTKWIAEGKKLKEEYYAAIESDDPIAIALAFKRLHEFEIKTGHSVA